MSQSELRNFEKSMAYHLAPAMLGIKPACLMSMEKNKDGLEENVELFNSRAYTKGMKLTVLCECKSRKLLFLYNEKLLSDRLADNRVRKLLESFGYDSRMTLEQQLERLSGRISASEDFPHEIGLFLGYPVDDVTGSYRTREETIFFADIGKSTLTKTEQDVFSAIMTSAEIICVINLLRAKAFTKP